ncbi:MAG: hypothetical protein JWO58_140 [Chitinophagaceae bacterium]|nr:hypothetical protein [Chitinophagaceae bacterium]
MTIQVKLIVLWTLILIGMILHFNYHVSEIFYGIDVTRPGAIGKVPIMAHVIKNIFYHVPLLIILSLLYINSRWYKMAHFILSLAFTLANAEHLLGEFKQDSLDLSQIPLLSIVLVISLLINKTSWDYYKIFYSKPIRVKDSYSKSLYSRIAHDQF